MQRSANLGRNAQRGSCIVVGKIWFSDENVRDLEVAQALVEREQRGFRECGENNRIGARSGWPRFAGRVHRLSELVTVWHVGADHDVVGAELIGWLNGCSWWNLP